MSDAMATMADNDSQTAGLLINLVIGLPTLAICLLAFDVLRRKVPTVFEARRALNAARSHLDYHANRVYCPPPPSNRLFGWVRPVLHLELDTIAETHGLDVALFLRFLRSMAFLFSLLTLACGAVLLPVYFTAANKRLPPDDPARVLGVQKFSLANVPQDDPWRFWVTLALDIALVAFVCAYLFAEFRVFSKQRRRYRSFDNPANYAVLVQDIPIGSRSELAIHSYWDRLFPGEIARVYFILDGAKLVAKKAKFWAAVTKRERAEWDIEFDESLAGSRPTHKIGVCACCRGSSAVVDSIGYWTEQQQHYGNKVTLYQQEMDSRHSPPTRAAIVVFHSRRTAAIAAQTSFSLSESQWRVSRAPEPNAVNWDSLGIRRAEVPVRKAVTILCTVLLTLFWIIPVSAIMGLANLSAIAAIEINGSFPFSFADDVKNWSPVITGFIESLLPAIILSTFLSLVPTIIGAFISISRVSSLARVDLLIRDWYFNFVIFSNFLFVVFAGSLLNKLSEIIDSPNVTEVVELLAGSIPEQGAFLMNFILLKALSETPQEILQLGRVIVRGIKLKYFARTPRERRDVGTGNTEFLFYRYYAISQLIAVLGLIYSTIAPFILPCCLAYFSIMYIVWKYNLCYSMHNPYSDGGRMYSGALYAVWIGLFIHLLTMIGIFGLNRNAVQSALIIIPTIIAVLFVLYCRKRYSRIIKHGAVLETQNRIEESDGADRIAPSLAEKYVHPGFEPLPNPVENLNGVDGNDGKTQYNEEEFLDRSLLAVDEMPVETEEPFDKSQQKTQNSMSTEDWRDAYSSPNLNDIRQSSIPDAD